MTKVVNLIPTAGGIGVTTLMTAVALKLASDDAPVSFECDAEELEDIAALLGQPSVGESRYLSFGNVDFSEDIEQQGVYHIRSWSKRPRHKGWLPGFNIGFVSSAYVSLRRAVLTANNWNAAVLWQLDAAALGPNDVQSVVGKAVPVIRNRYMADVQRKCDSGLFANTSRPLIFESVVDEVVATITGGK